MVATALAAAVQRVAGQRHILPRAAGCSDSHTRDTGVRADGNGTESACYGMANKSGGDRRGLGLFRGDGGAPAVGHVLADRKPVVHRVDFDFIPPGIGKHHADVGPASTESGSRWGLAGVTGVWSLAPDASANPEPSEHGR